jgi:transcription antitermination factor NusG
MLSLSTTDYQAIHRPRSAQWYILYTAPRAEKTVRKSLTEQNFETYLPVSTAVNTWKNRQKKIIETPLFPSYIFALGREKDLLQISQLPKVVTYLRNGSRPSTISQKEIDQIKGLISLQTELSVEPDIEPGDRVKITTGPLTGYEGILQKRKGKDFFGIQLKDLNRTIFIQLTTHSLEKIN